MFAFQIIVFMIKLIFEIPHTKYSLFYLLHKKVTCHREIMERYYKEYYSCEPSSDYDDDTDDDDQFIVVDTNNNSVDNGTISST